MSKLPIVIRSFITAVILTTAILLSINLVKSTAYHPRFTGREVFNSESEYQTFKQTVSVSKVHWTSMEALSSAPPIIVEFVVTAPADFPYGKADYSENLLIVIILVGAFPLLIITWVVWI